MILRSEVILLAAVAFATSWAKDTRASESGRPRGVGPEFSKFYRNPETFTCISHPSIHIPSSRVNDDFCDCPDGSDEPGTSACSFLSHLSPAHVPPPAVEKLFPPYNITNVLPGFYCKNKGHLPSYIRFESVNDGKCDYTSCCDGSDEFASVGGVKCPDRCGEIGKEYRKHEEARNKKLAQAMRRRRELQVEASRLRKEVETKIEDLEIKAKGFERKIVEAQETLKEVERKEKLRIVKSDVAGKGKGKTGVLLGLAKGRVEELRTALTKTRKQRDDMWSRIAELENVLAKLKEEWNPNFNDEGVKRAVNAWEDYATRETDDAWTEAEDRDLDEISKQDGEESGVNWQEFESSDEHVESDVAVLYQFTSYLPPFLRGWIDDKVSSLRQILVENGVLAAPGTDPSAPESGALRDARKTLEDAERDLSNTENDIRSSKEDLDKNYGPDSIFRALKNQCVSKESGEYTYELCFLGQTKQKSKRGGADTNMGNFVGFETEVVDDDVPLDGKGLGRGERIVMKYENGQHCWNGPNRSTKVILACSEENEIWKVSESEKCVYRMEVGSPAVCGYDNGDKQPAQDTRGKKDEL